MAKDDREVVTVGMADEPMKISVGKQVNEGVAKVWNDWLSAPRLRKLHAVSIRSVGAGKVKCSKH